MAPETKDRGGKYATTLDYTAARTGIKKPYIPAENRIVKALIGAALEGGLSYSDAVRLGIGVYKEIDVLARDEEGRILSRTGIKDIREYCRSILRSGQTFSAYEVAVRAVSAWRLTLDELAKLHAEWDRETVAQRLKLREQRKEQAAQAMESKPGADEVRGIVEPVLGEPERGSGFERTVDEYNELDPDLDWVTGTGV